ncbi:MAG: helix-turn-helix domain-containing protein [Spirochaetaceae bacterium]|jgi:transcriptional regulator with XRE-family HTH domain|nr:helix-turn-helix domain-containing protein [Spirochaetaceae bacterium]
MAEIRAILAENIKKFRQKQRITQSELAERASISVNFIGMIEQKRKFPAPEMLDRIATALKVETPELFSAYVSPVSELEKLHKAILADLDRAISAAVCKAIKKNCK